jgi:hypothetical protein
MMQKQIKNNKRGFTLLVAVVVTSMLLIISFVVVNIAYKQLVLATASEESQYAFYAADSGTECAVYWDLKGNASGVSSFDPTTPGSISCNGQTITTGSQTVPTIPSQASVIGGAVTSIFSVNFTKGCTIVRITKNVVTHSTTIDSRGYNTCNTSSPTRYERGVTLSYTN